MKLGVIYYRYPLFPGGSYIQEYVDTISRKTKQTVLIATQHPISNFPTPKKLKIIWIPDIKIPFLGDLIYNISVFFACFNKAFRDVDVINMISARGSLGGFLASKILKKPTVCTIEIINNEHLSTLDRYINKLQRTIYSLPFNHYISWSDFYRKKYLLPWGIKNKKISVIPGGIDLSRYNLRVSGSSIRKMYPRASTLIVFAKPMFDYNRKMAELLLDSVALLKNKHHIKILIGSGEQVELVKQKAGTLGLLKDVFFMPYVPITEIPKYIAASDIIVLPYTYAATTSRSLVESMAMGKPIITTSVGEIGKVVTNDVNALVVKPKKDEIAKAIQKLIKRPALALKIGRNARKEAENKYSIDSITDKTIEILKNTIK
jgi:glycosyltransferase involved in cell wall biosynthesis